MAKVVVNTSFAGSIASQQSFKSKVSGEKQRLTKRLKYNPRREPRCIAIQTDTRFTLFKYDEDTSGYVFDEVKSTQLEGKTIVTFEFLHNLPLVALGCSDGTVRFWNYSTNQVENDRKIQAHSKSILKMIVVIRIDPLIFLPSLITYGQDGALCSWNLDKGVAEFKLAKPFDSSTTTIVDMIYDSENGTILTLGSDKTIHIRRSANGNTIKVVKFTEKNPMRSLDFVSTINYLPHWLFFTAQNSKIYSMISSLDDEQLLQFDLYKIVPKQNWVKLKPKIVSLHTHPLQTNVFFLSTTNGILMFKMENKNLPMSKALFLPQYSQNNEGTEEKNEVSLKKPDIKAPEMTVPQEMKVPEMTIPDEWKPPVMTIPDEIKVPELSIPGENKTAIPLFKDKMTLPPKVEEEEEDEKDSDEDTPEVKEETIQGMFDLPEKKKKKKPIFNIKKKKAVKAPSALTTPRGGLDPIFDGIKPKYMFVGLPTDKPEQSLYYIEKSILYKRVVNSS
jgi:hypothetical protein